MGHGVPYKEYINLLRLESHFTSEVFSLIYQENKHTENITVIQYALLGRDYPRGRGTPWVFTAAKRQLHRTQEFQGHQEG